MENNVQYKKDLLSMTPEELEAFIVGIGEPKYRAAQIFPQLHKGISVFDIIVPF